MADAIFDGTDMIGQFFGKRQRVADSTRDTLPQRLVEAFNMIGLPRVLRDGLVPRRRNHPLIHRREIRVEYRLLLIRLRYVGPQVFSTLPTSVPDVAGDDLARLGIHRDPDPWLVGS